MSESTRTLRCFINVWFIDDHAFAVWWSATFRIGAYYYAFLADLFYSQRMVSNTYG